MEEQVEELGFELGRLPDETSRTAFLGRFPQLVHSQIVEQLADAVRTAVRVDLQRALALAEASLAIAEKLSDKEALARGLRAKANAMWFMGDCRSAVDLFQKAAGLFEQAGKMNEVGRTLSGSIQSLALLGEYGKAFAAAERAREIFGGLGESWRVARLEINVANIYHRQNRFSEALAAYERAYQSLLPHRDMEGVGVALHNMAVCLIALDDFHGALEAYGRVREFCEQENMPLLVAQADYNIAYLYYLRGDYTRALELLRTTRETCRKNGDTYHLGLCDLDQSEIYLELSLIAEAAEMAQNSSDHFQQLGMGYESARSLTNLAIALSLQGDVKRAIELFARAKNIVSGEENRVWPHLIDLYRALVLLDQNEFGEAHALCAGAADFFRSVPMPGKHVLCLLLLTRVHLRTSEFDEAAAQCEKALRVLEDLDSPILAYQAHFLRGQVYEALGQPRQAYDSYQASRRALEMLRSSLQKEELKIGLMRNRLEVYTRLIQLCLDRGSDGAPAEEALSYIEEAKSRTLRDLILGHAQPLWDNSQADETDRQVRELRQELNWYYHRIDREQFSRERALPADVELLKVQARTREHDLQRLLLDAPPSAYVGSALRKSSAATLEQIRSVLGSTGALLEYFAIRDRVYAAVVTKKFIKVIPTAIAAPIAQRLRMLQFQFSKFRLNRDYVARFQNALMKATQSHLRGLYEDVFAPLEDLVEGHDLVIVPYGPLHAVPFHALFDGQHFLVERFTICYEPSASIFTHSHRQPEIAGGPSLILGINDPGTPFIREEVQAVAAVVPSPQVLFGAEATEQALREHGRRSRLIHIASHGYFRQDSPMFSAIRLADSYLNLYDLYHMNFPVDLLTLSGCVTGLNVVEEGDELLGLTRGLLYAGARSLLLSLWDVDDRSTAEFMKEFYTRLQNQPGKAAALRAAMLNLRERYPHPYYWAPFKLIGRAL